MELNVWLTFLFASIVISASPGAGAVNTMSSGLRLGFIKTLPSIFGLQLGYCAQIIIVGIGLGPMLTSSKLMFYSVKWIGVVYLIWIGCHKWKEVPIFIRKDTKLPHKHGQDFWQAAFINMTNPKATILLITLFTQFIGTTPHIQTTTYFVMGITLILTDIIVMLGYAGLAQRLSCLINSERRAIYQNRTFACLFFVVAMIIAIS